MPSIAQIRAARGLLGWSQAQLAEAAGVSRATVNRAETIAVSAAATTGLVEALQKGGIIFVEENGEGPGVRLRKKSRR
jgi:transcriptional regulator with XRE-family HTH domain